MALRVTNGRYRCYYTSFVALRVFMLNCSMLIHNYLAPMRKLLINEEWGRNCTWTNYISYHTIQIASTNAYGILHDSYLANSIQALSGWSQIPASSRQFPNEIAKKICVRSQKNSPQLENHELSLCTRQHF